MKSRSWVLASLFLLFSVAVAGAQCLGISSAITLFPVTGAPFTAEYVHTFDPINRDGTRNHQEAHGQIYRDSEGRSRCDARNLKTGALRFVLIRDPVAGLTIALHPEEQTAIVTHHTPAPPSSTTQQNPAPKTTVTVQPSGNTHSEEDLPSQVIEGFAVTGKRYINTDAAGQTSTMEDWFSADLKYKLRSTWNSQSGGSTSDKVINIRRGDPDQSVFQVPDGFTVKNLYCREKICNYDSE